MKNSCPAVPFLLLFLLAISPLPTLCESNTTQAFDFLQHLQGCHKGQTVTGLYELKKYLKTFGYVNVHDSSGEHANDDEFDDILESQIRSYQLNYHLNASGILDAQTVRQMMMPRCGCEDTARATISMRSRIADVKAILDWELSLPNYSFFPGAPKWSKTKLTYGFRSSARDTDTKALKSVVASALSKWEAVTDFHFVEASSGDSDIVFGMHRLAHGDGVSFDGRGGQLAHAFAPSIGLCHYDADEKWSTDPDGSHYDMETVAIHEIGHVLGLGHSYDPDAIMYPAIQPGEKKRSLHQSDVQGIKTLYGQ